MFRKRNAVRHGRIAPGTCRLSLVFLTTSIGCYIDFNVYVKVVMELTFIHKSLANYGRETSAGKKIEDIYTKQVTKAYSPSAREDKDFQKAFDEMQETLAEARRATGVQFLCFRRMKETEKKKDGNKESSRKDTNAGRTRVARIT